MKPSRYSPNEFDAYGEGELLLIGAGMWLGLLFSFIGKLLVRAWREIAKGETACGFILGCFAGFILGIPIYEAWCYACLYFGLML